MVLFHCCRRHKVGVIFYLSLEQVKATWQGWAVIAWEFPVTRGCEHGWALLGVRGGRGDVAQWIILSTVMTTL
jgi:hypothetical protein